MALVIRMRQQGAKNRQTYRVIVTDERVRRDGKYLEKLGWYNPHAKENNTLHLDVPRLQHWLDQGAQVSDSVKALVQRAAPEVIREQKAKAVPARMKARAKLKKKTSHAN